MAEVTVRLLNAATDERHEAKADATGAFRFSLLPPGTYQVEFAREGFQTARMAELTLNASEVPVLDAVLAPGDAADHGGVRVPFARGRRRRPGRWWIRRRSRRCR